MNLDILPVIRESMGFASRQFETVARVSWFPLLLVLLFLIMFPYLQLTVLSGGPVTLNDTSLAEARKLLEKNQADLWQNRTGIMIALAALSYIVITVLYTSFIVPLLRLAARGEPVSHRSLSLSFGPRHLKFIGVSLLTIFGVSIVTLLPLGLVTNFINGYVDQAMQTQYAVFPDSDSLHTIKLENKLGDAAPFTNFTTSLAGVVTLILLYLSIRLFALPVFATVREKGDGYNSFGASWQLTKGWNTFWVALAAMVLAGTIYVVTIALNVFALPMIRMTLQAIYDLLAGVAGLAPDAAAEDPVLLAFLRWAWVVVNMIANMIWVFFLTGTVAGLGGALYRRIPGGEGGAS